MTDKRNRLWSKIMHIARLLSGCHQIPERSFFIHGYQLPLCARCTGITIGYLLALLLCIFQIIVPPALSVFMLIPLIADGGAQLLFCIMSDNIRRFVTGLIFGVGYIHLCLNTVLYLLPF